MNQIPALTHHWLAQQRVHPNADLRLVLPAELDTMSSERVLLLTNPALRNSNVLQEVRKAIGHRLVGVYDGISAHSPVDEVAAAAVAVLESKVDLVVALGGGSVIDAGKAACYASWNGLVTGKSLLEGLPKGWAPSDWDRPLEGVRLLAIPTTLSAAEFSSHAGITDLETGRKHVVLHPQMVPKVVILDPRATFETPAELLLSSAVRAVDHAVERFCSIRPTPFSDAVSRQAMEMLRDSLPMILRECNDPGPRATAQAASWLSIMGGWAGTPVGASHGLGYILGAYKGVPHGHTSCLMLHAVLRWNSKALSEDGLRRQELVASCFGGAASAGDGIESFVRSLQLPTRLSAMNIQPSQFADIAAQYDGSGPILTNPRRVAAASDLIEILEIAQ